MAEDEHYLRSEFYELVEMCSGRDAETRDGVQARERRPVAVKMQPPGRRQCGWV